MTKTFPKPPAQTGLLVLLLLCLFLAAAPGAALAGEPATVTVRVEGASTTLLREKQVTTNTTPIYKKGKTKDTCAGTSAAGALQLATEGSWEGAWFGTTLGYSVETILGETHSLSGTSPWEFWLNYKPSEDGVCDTELSAGDQLLFFPECFGECPAAPSVLSIEAPASAAAGEKITVTVTAHPHSGEAAPAKGATVEYEGASATTNSEGRASVEFAHAGEQEVKASATDAIRDEADVCVYTSEDEDCGDRPSGPGSKGGGVAGYTGTGNPDPAPGGPGAGAGGISARLTSVVEGRHYRRNRAPRVLAGSIATSDRLSSVSLLLRRAYRGRCYAYDGSRERFVRIGCARGSFFALPSRTSFSYLLPGPLAPGRYVLELRAQDTSGARTALRLGSTEVVFYVG